MIVPQYVREIAYFPIYQCLNLSEVRFLKGSRLEKIGDGAFAGTDIRDFVAPQSLREVGHAAFINCKSLMSANLGQAEKIGDFCFCGTVVHQTKTRNVWAWHQLGQESLVPNKVALPQDLRVAKGGWFSYSQVRELHIPKGVEEIQDYAFVQCRMLTKVTFARNSQLKKIGQGAFTDTQISEFEAPLLLESIGVGAFRGTRLETFVAPTKLNTIGKSAFRDCKCLKRVELNDGLEVLGNAF